jgi:hypothetical protein
MIKTLTIPDPQPGLPYHWKYNTLLQSIPSVSIKFLTSFFFGEWILSNKADTTSSLWEGGGGGG